MTGSGGWAYFAVTHYMLGIRPGFDELIIDPCIPGEWDGFEVSRIFRGVTYNITVKNPNHIQKGVKIILLDGHETEKIPVFETGSEHAVEVIMG